MTLPDDVSPRRDFLDALARTVPSLGANPVLLAVDGVDGSGKSTFAKNLAGALRRIGRPAIVIHADDFLHLRTVRHRRGRNSPQGFWLDSYDYVALSRNVLTPLSSHGNGRYRPRSTDLALDEHIEVEEEQVPAEAVVIVGPGATAAMPIRNIHRCIAMWRVSSRRLRRSRWQSVSCLAPGTTRHETQRIAPRARRAGHRQPARDLRYAAEEVLNDFYPGDGLPDKARRLLEPIFKQGLPAVPASPPAPLLGQAPQQEARPEE